MVYDIEDTRCVRESEKALLVESEKTGRFWVPKSQVAGNSEVSKVGDLGVLCITKWFADQAGLR